jgi:DHA2 family methylenomycin A resistance protein-like MFS transporter
VRVSVTQQEAPQRPSAPGRAARRHLLAYTLVSLLLQIDGTLITIAVPRVASAFSVSPQIGPLLLSAYFVPYAAGLIPGGRLVDRYGGRRPVLWGLALFAVAGVLGALAPTFWLLVVSRVIQGLAAGLASPAALAGAVAPFRPEQRGRALGVFGSASGVAHLIGPFAGGAITQWWGWRANWWVLVPAALLCGYGIVRTVSSARPAPGPAVVGRIYNRTVLLATASAGISFIVLIGSFLLAQEYLQTHGFSPLAAAVPPTILAAVIAVAAPRAGRFADRRGNRPVLLAAFGALGIGFGVLAVPAMPLTTLAAVPAVIVVGLGLGLVFAPTTRAALNAVSESAHGRAAALLNAARLVGAAIGAALVGVAFIGGVTTAHTHRALAVAAVLSLAIGVPLSLGIDISGKRPTGPAAEGEPS